MLENVVIQHYTTPPLLSSISHTPTQLRLILTFHMSKTYLNKGQTIDSYPGESQCVLVVPLIIDIADHYPMRGLLP